MADFNTEERIRYFLNEHIARWNACDREAFTALYQEAAPNGLIIEYVGQPIGDGWEAFNYMWDNYNATTKAGIELILVNGNEGACYYHNISRADESSVPTIEIYKFYDGKLHIRYFHNHEALV